MGTREAAAITTDKDNQGRAWWIPGLVFKLFTEACELLSNLKFPLTLEAIKSKLNMFRHGCFNCLCVLVLVNMDTHSIHFLVLTKCQALGSVMSIHSASV